MSYFQAIPSGWSVMHSSSSAISPEKVERGVDVAREKGEEEEEEGEEKEEKEEEGMIWCPHHPHHMAGGPRMTAWLYKAQVTCAPGQEVLHA